MISYIIQINCDGCNDGFQSLPQQSPDEKATLDMAFKAGWLFADRGKHFCDECRKKKEQPELKP